MPTFLVHPDNLETLHECPEELEVCLEVEDDRDDYCTEEGNGAWICVFLEFLEEKVRERCRSPRFEFSNTDRLDADVLEEVQERYLRSFFIAFANEHFEAYRDDDVSLPDYGDVCGDYREYCDDCESGWEEIHSEYDGPLAEDVEENEDEAQPGLTRDERREMRLRNQERQAERERRESDQEEAENEVIDREFVCDDDCDGFLDHINDCFYDRIEFNTEALQERWDEFLEEIGETVMPEFCPEVRP